jgi:hypothetical protein
MRKMIRWPDDRVGDFWTVDDNGTEERPLYTPIAGPYRMFREHFAVLRVLDGLGQTGEARAYAVKRAAGLAPDTGMYSNLLSELERRELVSSDGGAWRCTEAGRSALHLEAK